MEGLPLFRKGLWDNTTDTREYDTIDTRETSIGIVITIYVK
ncbi:hypothetical protein DDD_0697 [Nonlabens dokdonensis DSW-6]|uniref:Uncharacterized protein n=1 Tax=Nonlabens dokdonensis (strain DSM 17205 / KCTC 12402 / DSW-6) TaxID=592029 RepID=L7W6U3_NONDD|nr:hypothetical protein DDD_0697 [Nonlabens dokdonensis DSW-6]